MLLLSAANRKAVDEYTILEVGISGEELVERAARAVEKAVLAVNCLCPSVDIVCGYGNNGADGLALARMLAARELPVTVWLVGSGHRATDLWKKEKELLPNVVECRQVREEAELPEMLSGDVIVDALFGIGLNRPLTELYGRMVEKINRVHDRGATVVSVDIPSGVFADTGYVDHATGYAVQADETVVMGFATPAHYLENAARYCGRVTVADIGLVRPDFIQATAYIGRTEAWTKRVSESYKNTYGSVWMMTGSVGMAGASLLSAESALRVGAGLVYVNTPEENRVILQVGLPEAIWAGNRTVDDIHPTACVVGCGLGQTAEADAALQAFLENNHGPLVLDADGLNLVAAREERQAQLRAYEGPKVITPHLGELSRLTGWEKKKITDDLPGAARYVADHFQAVCVAKCSRTVVAAPGKTAVYINTSGHPCMAKAGSGDVLAGMIGGVLAQNKKRLAETPEVLSSLVEKAVYLHGLAGEMAATYQNENAVLASHVIECIGDAIDHETIS